MLHPRERRRRWLHRLALALRIAVALLTLGVFLVAGGIAAAALGSDSPLVWTIALVAGLGIGLLVMSKPELHGIADRLERAADGEERGSPHDESPRPDT